MKKILLALSLALATVFSCFAANPESDFNYDLADQKEVKVLAEKFKELNPKEDYIAVSGYKGNVRGKKIEIPEEIEGCKVIKVAFNGNERIYVDKVIIPASVVYFDNTYSNVVDPQIEFLRDKDQPFIWKGSVNLSKQEKLPVDRKIIFLYPGQNLKSTIRIPRSENKFTWPKNWTWAGLYENDYWGGDNQFHWVNPGFKFPDNSQIHYSAEVAFEGSEIELSFEEGFEELPIIVSSSAIKKLILPNSLKKITKDRRIRIGDSSDYKGTIVFPEGAKITIEPGAIDCDNLSISTLKALKAMGYNTDN